MIKSHRSSSSGLLLSFALISWLIISICNIVR